VRAVFSLAEATQRSARQWLTRYETTIEIEGGEKAALAAQWLTMLAKRG
jgi:hypothetical protein